MQYDDHSKGPDGYAAVDHHVCAGHIGTCVARQQQGRPGKFGGVAPTPEGGIGSQGIPLRLAQHVARQVGQDRTRRDTVDRYAMRPKLQGLTVRHADQRPLRRTIDTSLPGIQPVAEEVEGFE